MDKALMWQRRCSLAALCFAFIVIGLGALTRLVDAGLGCPDWPGCYGHLTVVAAEQDQQLSMTYPQTPLVSHKAWAEMVHRYCAGTLSLLIVVVLGILIYRGCKEKRRGLFVLAIGLLLLIIYQIMLGRWTVTLQLLPTIVTQHLLGGFFIISLLGLSYANTYPRVAISSYGYFTFALLGVIIVLGQIFLGAWTSTHYAALSCSGFPFCQQDSMAMTFDWQHAFQWKTPVGINYEGGRLSEMARQTIQMVHRMGAMVVFLYWFLFFFMTRGRLAAQTMKSMSLILIVLTVQIVLGIANAVFLLPLLIAILHNMMAAALLLSTVWFTYQLYPQTKRVA